MGNGHETDSSWSRTEAGILVIRDAFHELEDEFGIKIPATWFVRADRIIGRQFGMSTAIFRNFSTFLHARTQDSHEIGWMPQVYETNYAPESGTHLQQTEPYSTQLYEIHEDLIELGYPVNSVRMGDCYHDNQTMDAISRLGIRFDSSALPGRSKFDSGWRLDWSVTSAHPYFPSLSDYRLPGDLHHRVLEIPLTLTPIQADYDRQPLLRYVNPCMQRKYLWQNLESILEKSSYLMCILHPDEIVLSHGEGHPLIAYSRKEVLYNLHRLVEICRQSGREPTFHTLEKAGGKFLVQSAEWNFPDIRVTNS